jgi:hypothetical protein
MAQMDDTLGCVVAVGGSQMTVTVNDNGSVRHAIRIGGMVKARCVDFEAVGTIAAIQLESSDSSSRSIFVVDLLGEIATAEDDGKQFRRGVPFSVRRFKPRPRPTRRPFMRDRQPQMSALGHFIIIRGALHSSSSTICYRRTSRYSVRPVQENHVPLL